MKKLLLFTLATVFVISACSKADKADTNAAAQEETKTEIKKDEMAANTESDKLQKWPADYPVDGDSVAVVVIEQDGKGELGTVVIEFYPDKAPNHVRNFQYLANSGYYDGINFHRVIKGFMIQGGDPTGTGSGGPGWTVDAEFNDTPHTKGVLSAARTQDPNSAGSQFFLCHEAAPHLDGQYTVFGKAITGLDVVDAVATTPVQGSSPTSRVYMKSVKIVPRSEAPLD